MIKRLLIAALLAFAAPALAVQPDEVLADPALEERARDISKGLRCLVCQNESIDESNAELARDLRIIVRERLVAGDSDDQVRGYLVARYGDYVLLRPPLKASTYALWFGPPVLLGAGVLAAFFFYRRGKPGAADPAPLSPDEQRRLAALLDESEK